MMKPFYPNKYRDVSALENAQSWINKFASGQVTVKLASSPSDSPNNTIRPITLSPQQVQA